VNCFKKNTNVSHEAINELELELGDLRAKKLVHSKARLITPSIRDCVKMAECSSEHLPVIIHSESAISSEDYIALGADFLQHFQSI
jgi:cellulose biosynthesis protein BcsQ